MEFKYKCPVCRAGNVLTPENSYCRRCRCDLSPMYRAKKKNVYKLIRKIVASGGNEPI